MIVVDASVLAPALVDMDDVGERARARVLGEVLAAPDLIDLEVASVLRGTVRAGLVEERRARQALDDLGVLALRRWSHRPWLPRIWALRDNLTVYDAAYVALAEALQVPLVTADGRLARAPGISCPVEVLV